MSKVKIVSGWSNPGGSTTVFINLTNLFNENGISCTFYGPHEWHMGKCKSGSIKDLDLQSDDILICHYISFPNRPNVKKVLFSCHEKWWFDFSKIPVFWDKVIFLHKEHRKFHNAYKGPFSIIPNVKENLTKKDKTNISNIAGVIGSIEDRKQTHISIQRALDAGCSKVYIFGGIQDPSYFNTKVSPLLKEGLVEYKGYASSKQDMYDSIGRVYHSSKGEVACLVKDECFSTGTEFFGNTETENTISSFSNKKILDLWLEEFK